MSEQTRLTPQEESEFRRWAATNGITDYDASDAHYDMRGFWKQTQGSAHPPGSEQHFPDTFKQHGHPKFSEESQYSGGRNDGGRWIGDRYIPGGADLLSTSRRDTASGPLAEALALLVKGMRQ